MHYSESPYGVGYTQGGGSTISHSEEEGQHLGPQGIMVFHDYDKGIAHAKKVGLPIMIDFTGWACVNCVRWKSKYGQILRLKEYLLMMLYLFLYMLMKERP